MAARKTAAKPAATTKTAAKPAARRTTAKKETPAKAAPKPTRSRAKAPVEEEEEEDLLSGLENADTSAADDDDDDDEEMDLLDDITEDNGDPWMPATEDEHPDGIQGRIVNVSTIYSDEAYGGGEVPLLEIEEADGHVWSVRGYHTVLKNQIERNAPQVGDRVALKYFGPKTPKKGGKDYENYGMKCPSCDKRKRG